MKNTLRICGAFFLAMMVCITSHTRTYAASSMAVYDMAFFNVDNYKLNTELRVGVDLELGLQSYYFNESSENKTVFLFHGGAFMSQPMDEHYLFADDIASKTGAEVIMPIYPLIPWHNYADAYNKLIYQYAQYIVDNPGKEIVFMGDSAGGCIAIGLCQRIHALGMPMPSKLVLISPWVDISMSSPSVLQYVNTPVGSGITTLQAAANFWSRGTQGGVYDPLTNPVMGSCEGFPQTLIITGTQDMFFGDIVAYGDKLSATGIPVEMVVGEGMLHDYPILFWQACSGTTGETIARFINT